MIRPEDKPVVMEFLRIFLLVLFVGGISFLCLLQRVRSRELDFEITRLNSKRADVIKEINELDYRIEQLKSPGRIIPLAEEKLGMKRRE